jgi:hypothetical protein
MDDKISQKSVEWIKLSCATRRLSSESNSKVAEAIDHPSSENDIDWNSLGWSPENFYQIQLPRNQSFEEPAYFILEYVA